MRNRLARDKPDDRSEPSSTNAAPPTIPHLTRSALHRCLQRHGVARLPDAEGKLYLLVGIDRTSKFAVTQFVENADRKTAREAIQHMLEAMPYQVHTIFTDNGVQFAEQPRNRNTICF